MRFSEVFGQEIIKENLIRSIKKNKMSHAYILNGERGMGKSDLAEAFAAALLCENHGDDSCGECRTCRRIDSHNHPDVIRLQTEGKDQISVKDIKSRLNGDISIRPYESDYKIYIIPNAHLLNRECQNAILKTIEEPPEYAIIFLLADNIEGLLPTILSRCVKLDLAPVDNESIKNRIMQEPGMSEDRAAVIAAYALGNIGKALTLANDEVFIKLMDDVVEMLKEIPQYSDASVLSKAQYFDTNYKDRLEDLIDLLEVWYRDVLLYKSTDSAEGLMIDALRYQVRQHAKAESYKGIGIICDEISIAKRRVKSNANNRLAVEQLLFCIREYS